MVTQTNAKSLKMNHRGHLGTDSARCMLAGFPRTAWGTLNVHAFLDNGRCWSSFCAPGALAKVPKVFTQN